LSHFRIFYILGYLPGFFLFLTDLSCENNNRLVINDPTSF